MGLHWAPLSPLKWIHWLKVKHPVTGTAFPRFDWQWDGITLGTLQIIHLKIYPIEGENPAIGKTSHLWIGNLSIYTQGNPLVTRNTKPVWIQHFLTAPSMNGGYDCAFAFEFADDWADAQTLVRLFRQAVLNPAFWKQTFAIAWLCTCKRLKK